LGSAAARLRREHLRQANNPNAGEKPEKRAD